MSMSKSYLSLFVAAFLFSVFSRTSGQVQLLWTSPATVGEKRPLPEVNSSKVRFCYVVDGSTNQCRLYDADSFSLVYTITGVTANETPWYCLNDMNGNGSPEVFVLGAPPRIIDASTSVVIYSWTTNDEWVGFFTTPGSNTLKIAFWNPASGSNSLSVYSLGITEAVGQSNSTGTLPNQFTVQQNFPNPFNPKTTIQYAMPHADHVSIEVFDIAGKLIKTLVSEWQEGGLHSIVWDGFGANGLGLSSGTYFYTAKIGNEIEARKMILLK
jgi:FlgD Ig-like domain